MKRPYLFIFIASILFSAHTFHAVGATLQKISRNDSKNKTQIYFAFDQLPRYTTKIKGKRVDIFLQNTNISRDLETLETDDRIIKTSFIQNAATTVITFYLRYHPQKLTANDEKNILVIDILVGNTFTKSYADVSNQLEGVTLLERETIDYANPYNNSPYIGDWKSFFYNYETKVSINLDLKLTIPPFPVIALLSPEFDTNIQFLPEDALTLGNQELWNVLLLSLQQSIAVEQDAEKLKLLALTYGEVLFRSGDFPSAYKQLYLLAEKYPTDQIGLMAQYLFALLRGKHEDVYIGGVELRKLDGKIHPKSPLAPYQKISLIETAIATGQLDRAKELLQTNTIGYPDNLLKTRELRYADYLFKMGKTIRGYVLYDLIQDPVFVSSHPHSLNNFCSSLYDQKKFPQASSCFNNLLRHEVKKENSGLISYKKSMSSLKYGNPEVILSDLTSIEDAFPGTDAGFKAAIKKVDILTLLNDTWDENSAKYYRALSAEALTKETSEEAALKEAITYRLMDDYSKSISLTMSFLRNFRTGGLTDTAEALLIEMIPFEIKKLVTDKRYIDALVLAKQNRKLFEKNWVDIQLLSEIAMSYTRIGIYKEAERLYLFLIEILGDDLKEKFYYPLIETIYTQGDYDLVENYANQYSYNFPNGSFKEQINTLFLKSLFAEKKYDQALQNIPKVIPEDIKTQIFIATIFFHTNNPLKVVDILEPIFNNKKLLDDLSLYMLADSLYATKRFNDSKAIFTDLVENDSIKPQVLYRLSNIEKEMGNHNTALKIMEQIVEIEEESLWKEAAKRELEFDKFNSDFNKIIKNN